MKRQLSFLILFLTLALGAAAANRVVNVKGTYTTLDASAGVNVLYVPGGSATTVTISGPDDRIYLVEVKMKGKTLCIAPKPDRNGSRNGNRIKDVTVSVTGPAIPDFNASAGADIICHTTLSLPGQTVRMEASAGAGIKFDKITAAAFNADASAGAGIKAGRVNADKANLDASAGADIVIEGLGVGTANLVASAGADIKISAIVAKTLNADASAGAGIKLSGEAVTGNLDASAAGTINARDLSLTHSNISRSTVGSVKTR